MFNIYAWIILGTLIFSYFLSLVTNRLNLKALSTEVPDEFKDIFDADAYKKSQEYTRAQTRFGFISGSFSLLITLVFWFAGGFEYLDQLVRGWGYGSVLTGLLFIASLVLLRGITSLPFSIYATFVLEDRFGFNKTTVRTFILDLLKGLGLSIILGAPLLAALLYFFDYAGENAWLYCWLITIGFTLVIQYVAPRWLMPLFNKFTPLEQGELRESIEQYARSVKFPLREIFVMDGSKRSTKSNAFFTGFGKNKRVVFFDTLINNHSVGELTAVLAHEVGHYKKRHIIQSLIISIIHTGVVFYLLSIFLGHKGLFDAFYMSNMSVYAGLVFFGMLYAPIELILSVFMNIFSRKNEYTADRYAVKTTQNAENMITALKKLSRHNLSNLTPHPWYVFLKYSHPPVLQRIRTIRQIII